MSGADVSGAAGTPEGTEGARPADAARRALRAARDAGADADGRALPETGPGTDPGAVKRRPTGEAGGARPGDAAREALRRASESRTATPDAGRTAPGDESEEQAKWAEPAKREQSAGRESSGRQSASEPRERDDRQETTDPRETSDRRETSDPRGTGERRAPGARPGDIAREALRAARDAAEGARLAAEEASAERVGRGSGRGSRPAVGQSGRLREARGGIGDGAPAGDRAGRGPGAFSEGRRPGAPRRDRVAADRARAVRELLADAFKMPADDVQEAGGAETTGPVAVAAWGPDHRPGVTEGEAARTSTPGLAADGTADEDATGAARATDGAAAWVSGGVTTTRASGDGADVPQAAPRVPRSMAAPSRDGELRRTFRPFPPRASAGEAFAESWWGNAWVAALEEGALDAARLARGRAYADKGNVDAITVTPGLVLAYVHGSRPRPYRVQLRLRTLDDTEWDRFLDAAAEQPAHIAALLDKELPPGLADPGAGPAPDRGVRLLPGPRELDPRCSCPDFGHPCKHAAALCYQTARLLDEDPFVLLLLRGRGERELLDALSRRNAARAARAAQEQEPAPLPGVRARDALAPRTLPPLPAPLPPPPHPEQPPVYPGAPGGPDPFALDQLATDAAARAHALLTTGRDPVAELTLWQDAVRLAAARPGSGLTATTRALYSSLAAATGRTPADLARAVAAWRQGGLEGLAVLEEPWDPPAGRFDRARPLLLAADLPAFRPWRNHLTHPHGHLQLRLGHDGLWYAYESDPGHDDWWPRGTPDLDPVGALTGLGAADD
ncbi:SWIM zinc finger family protein [Streptomyces deccanensis]|uniref:SWIM zinc finger family protein n=1 Tax=Streptomyces deccanensis TaxID=424188 RepID=UPI001EFB4CE8|nr:SWIM zinc finger family protein [Streptomyces deccanensis]ULR56266.1 SWIM zinc finger family protein [Streptomyces deccanensis]